MKNAFILGGTRGIGLALTSKLLSIPAPSSPHSITQSRLWNVHNIGRADYDVLAPTRASYFNLNKWTQEHGDFDVFVYCAGDLTVQGNLAFRFASEFYEVCTNSSVIFNEGCKIIAVSSMAAIRPAKNNPFYSASKSALESFVRTVSDSALAKRKNWTVVSHRFDLVATDMLKLIPTDQRAGRSIISAEEAARQLYEIIIKENK